VVLLEDGDVEAGSISPKIGRTLTIPARKKVVVRWVHAGLPDLKGSLAKAQDWLKQDWAAHFARIEQAAESIPDIETGDEALDVIMAWSYYHLIQAYLKPTASLPFASFVATRQPGHGYSPRGDGGDYDRSWSGQTPTGAYLAALGIAPIDGQLAQGVIRNYLAVQQPDGWIDGKPGLGGQGQGGLCLPILARLTWGIFQYTEDAQFLRDVFPGLLKFFQRWFAADVDADQDGIPEWQSENQTGYSTLPTFSSWQGWGQSADIRLVESPDLAAYLLSEAKSLREIAYYLRDSAAESQLNAQVEKLQASLDSLWDATAGRYTYRDRDTHLTTQAVTVIEAARGGEELLPALELKPANRLIIQVTGGVNLVPRFSLKLDGFAPDGQAVSEVVKSEAFLWSTGRGVYTSRQVFSQIDRVQFDGLTRVYRVDVKTFDTTRLDITALLPLWSAGISAERSAALTALLLKPETFWRPNGVTMCSAQDPQFDPANAQGGGGVWPFWLTLIGEGLIETGSPALAYDLLKRLLAAQSAVLKEQKDFAEFYHSDVPKGLGERGHVNGIVPVYLVMRILGVRVISSGKVWVGGPFVWDGPMTIRQHGVTVRRSSEGAQVTFPSGYSVNVSGDAWQEIVDPGRKPAPEG
jgi:hypothetical protein